MKREVLGLLIVLSLIFVIGASGCGNYQAASSSPSLQIVGPEAIPSENANPTSSTPTVTSPPASVPAPIYVKTYNDPSIGNILADDNGVTLYTFTNDGTDKSSCYDACATLWPPMIVSSIPLSRSSLPSGLGMIARTDGTQQATYNHMPLYYYSKDTGAGQTNGQGFNNKWYVITVNSQPTTPAPSSSSGGYGY